MRVGRTCEEPGTIGSECLRRAGTQHLPCRHPLSEAMRTARDQPVVVDRVREIFCSYHEEDDESEEAEQASSWASRLECHGRGTITIVGSSKVIKVPDNGLEGDVWIVSLVVSYELRRRSAPTLARARARNLLRPDQQRRFDDLQAFFEERSKSGSARPYAILMEPMAFGKTWCASSMCTSPG